ncbi:MAG: hypothetical protein RMI34_06430 [Chloroherpetonaceae bacterium]|nr:hypothetical protein [Chloroherpetonaceae bacterium]MCS7211275.1 hypothetical protein [Chloroherpetonaceae bacterium]MDW8019695.1 hypothetical protein [Chloroherpetonaceae bacterium]MDW8465223.1 hypothetical protein [Chloroherpetonaceae bacterium]
MQHTPNDKLPSRQRHLSQWSRLLWLSAVINFVSALMLLHRATDGFSTALPTTQAGSSIVGATFAATMLLIANLVYQLMLQRNIPFSIKMLIGFIFCEMLFSLFLWSLH